MTMISGDLTAQEARQALYEIMRKEASFEEKASEALELGTAYLSADNGHVTRIDTKTDHWEALASTDPPDGRIPAGTELALETTYCRRTIAADSPVTLHDAPEQGWADDPAFQAHGFHCYHGTTLVLDDEPYGTVCFVADDSRGERFSDGETMFAELVTRLLERELERERHQAELGRQANLVNVLNRVLRHNLRNDMSVVRGRVRLMAEQLEDDPHSETVIRKTDGLIELSQKARELERIVGTEFAPRETNVRELVEEVVADVETGFPATSFDVDGDETVTVDVLSSFERAIQELVENAAKHSEEGSTVAITVEHAPNAVEITISDEGPGLSGPEREVLDTGVETPLIHGSGLGLWLVHWIVSSHGGSVEATTTDDGTTMTISVPRTAETRANLHLTELKRARDQYQAAFQDAFDAMLILNDEAIIVDANPAAADIYGLGDQELLGRSIRDFLPEDFEFEQAWADFQRAGAERDTVTVVGAGGDRHPVEYSAAADIVPGQHLVVVRELSDQTEQAHSQVLSE